MPRMLFGTGLFLAGFAMGKKWGPEIIGGSPIFEMIFLICGVALMIMSFAKKSEKK